MRHTLSFFSVMIGLLFPIGELQAGSASTTVLFSAFFMAVAVKLTRRRNCLITTVTPFRMTQFVVMHVSASSMSLWQIVKATL